MIKLKRVYDPAASADGKRFLVERLWPRAVRKADLKMDAWLKDVAPSTTLRQWFGHDPGKWKEFQRRYFIELKSRADVIEPILEAARIGSITLLYSSHDHEHNNAVALKSYLDEKISKKQGKPKRVA